MTRAIILFAILAPALAAAEPSDIHGGIAPHVNGGIEILGGGAFSAGFRGHVGLDQPFGSHRVQPSLGLGATFGAGVLSVEDPRALDGTVSLGYADYGPELQLGIRWVNGGVVDSRIFASVAYVHTRLDSRLMLDPVEGISGTNGMRATLGFNWADRIFTHDSDETREQREWGWTMVFVPQQIELGWERSCGSDRVGLTLGWGI